MHGLISFLAIVAKPLNWLFICLAAFSVWQAVRLGIMEGISPENLAEAGRALYFMGLSFLCSDIRLASGHDRYPTSAAYFFGVLGTLLLFGPLPHAVIILLNKGSSGSLGDWTAVYEGMVLLGIALVLQAKGVLEE